MALDISKATGQVRRRGAGGGNLQTDEGKMTFNSEFYTHPSGLCRARRDKDIFKHLKSQKFTSCATS